MTWKNYKIPGGFLEDFPILQIYSMFALKNFNTQIYLVYQFCALKFWYNVNENHNSKLNIIEAPTKGHDSRVILSEYHSLAPFNSNMKL